MSSVGCEERRKHGTVKNAVRLTATTLALALALRAQEAGPLVHLRFEGSLRSEGTRQCEVTWQGNPEAEVWRKDHEAPDPEGVATAAPTYPPGVNGQALCLSASSYVELACESILTPEAGSICFWYRQNWHSATAPTPPWRFHFVTPPGLSNDVPKSETTPFRGLYYWVTPKSVFAAFSRSKKHSKHFQLKPPWREEEWNHIAMTWQSGTPLRIYVNGVGERQDGDVDTPQIAPADGLLIGCPQADISEHSLSGLVDELAVWDRRLSLQEVQTLVRKTQPPGFGLPAAETTQFASGWVDVKQAFGAVGDGKADDTAALQKALRSRQVIMLSPGIYRVTDTLRLANDAQLVGPSADVADWNPQGQATLLYDGPEGGAVLLADRTKHIRLRDFGINGNDKAGIGLKWINCFFTASSVRGLSITRTNEHALYLAWMGVVSFQDLSIRGNHGNGITIGSYPNEDEGTGEVNAVSFTNCGIIKNAQKCGYDGAENVRTGYGFGILGHCTNITVTTCTIEANGGPGVYIGPGRKVCVMVRDSYFESNCQALIAKDRELHGEDFLNRSDRQPLGRKVSLLVDSPDSRMSSVVFENVFIAGKRNGIWVKGETTGMPIQFRRIYKPNVVYSEHGNWEWIDSTHVPVAGVPGINVRAWSQQWATEGAPRRLTNFIPGTDEPSGHPGIRVERGVRTILPSPPAGLALFVDTDGGDDRNDGRTAGKAWRSLAKVSALFRNTELETPFTVEVRGATPCALDLSGVGGSGALVLKLRADVRAESVRLRDIRCRVEIVGTGDATVGTGILDRCPAAVVRGVRLRPGENETGLQCLNGTNAKVLGCVVEGGATTSTGLLADLSRVFVRGGTIRGVGKERGVVAVDGGTVTVCDLDNACGQARDGGTITVAEPAAGQ